MLWLEEDLLRVVWVRFLMGASFRFCGPRSHAAGWRLVVRVTALLRTGHRPLLAVYPNCIRVGASRILRMRAGTPATTAFGGTSRVTTAFVPITALSPTVTPRRMQAP
jgi:hypothetical protein